METQQAKSVHWARVEVTSPDLDGPVAVVVAKDVPYLPDSNRFQTLSLYLPETPETSALIGTPAHMLPRLRGSTTPRYHVHIHGGAWRDPELTSASIEPTVAHAFSPNEVSSPIEAIASINYRLSQFPTHPTLPYDAVKDNHSDPSREATHPDHVSDVLHALALLRAFGVTDQSYILSGHSSGGCLAFQAILRSPADYGLEGVPDAPCPVAVLGLNGLYDLPALVHGLGASHEHLRDEYETMLSYAFGADENMWPAASPALFDPGGITRRVQEGRAPRLIVLDESTEDQLVPMNQMQRLEANLRTVDGLQVVVGHRLTGKHAAPWEQGAMIWKSLQDVAALLNEHR